MVNNLNTVNDRLTLIGYSDCFYKNGELWGFKNDSVTPKPIPLEIIATTEQQVTSSHITNWTKFSWNQRLRFWCDRVWHNLKVTLSLSTSLNVANVLIPAEQTLVLGNSFRFRVGSDSLNIFSILVENWQRIIYFSIAEFIESMLDNPFVALESPVKVYEKSSPYASLVVDRTAEGPEALLAMACSNWCTFRSQSDELVADMNIWIICDCDPQLAEVVEKETGFPKHYFQRLPSYNFWVYIRKDRRLLLAEISNTKEA